MLFFSGRTRTLRHFGAACVTAATILSGASAAHADEFRGFWVDAFHNGFLNATQVTNLVNHCKTYNFNAVVVQMRRRGDAWYMPQSPNQEPRTTALASNYDALAELISKCHASTPRIQVHCWVPTMLVWGDQNNAPTQAGHIYNQHPEYLMRNSSGATYIGEGYYVDPGHPDAMTWNLNMAKDIVSRYNIDGFQWDYVRYPAQDSGYNPTAIARYNAEFGTTGQPSSSNAQFSTWRRRQVTDFVRWANSELYAIKPSLPISAAVFASRSDAFNARFQDWSAWTSEGIVDLLFPMNYTATNSTYNSRVDDAVNHQGIRKIYMGPGAYLNTASNTVTQLNYARSKGLWGVNLYSYAVPNSGTVNQTNTFTYIKNNFQPTYTPPRTLPWKSNPTKGIAKGKITRQSNGAIVYNATVTIGGKSQLTEAHGAYAIYELSPGTYSVSATASGLGIATGSVNVTAGGVVNLNLALPNAPTGGTEVIIDNPSATMAGTWTLATSATDKYGADYRYKGPGTSSEYLQYTPNLTAGTWEVSEWHSQGTNRTTAAPHVITHAGGSATVNVNQRVNGGKWNVLGTYSFNAGSTGQARITANFSSGTGSVVMADAVRFRLITPADIIVDNSNAGFTASTNWTAATSAADKYGADYRYRSTAAVTDPAQWSFSLPQARNYEVYAWWSQGSNRSATAPYLVTHSSGTTTVNRNQQSNGGTWNTLGTFSFASGSNKVQLSCYTTTGYVIIADAIKLVAR